MVRRAPSLTLALVVVALGGLLLASPPAALADGKEEKRRKVTDKLAQRLGVPPDDLFAAGGERWASRDPVQRRAFLVDLGAAPRGSLLPLVVEAALEDDDFECRHGAVELLSVVGLEADRAVYLERLLPAVPKLLADKSELIYLDVADEVARLERWMRCDEDVCPTLERLFASPNLKVAGKGLQGLLRLEHPALRAGVATKAVVEVLRAQSRFGPPERKRAVLAVPEHRDAATAQALAAVMLQDGPIAVEIAQVLGQLGEVAVLPTLRKVGPTSSHALRIPAYRARGLLDDHALLQELPPAVESDHVNIQIAIIEAISRLTERHTDEVLEKAATAVKDPGVRRAVALARLRRGVAADVELLRPLVAGEKRDGAVTDEVLSIAALRDAKDAVHDAAAPLVVAIAKDPDQGARRERAIDLLGDPRHADEAARLYLKRAALEGDPSGLRLRAAASLLQLGVEGSVATVTTALIDLDVVTREDVKTTLGTARRFSGSPLLLVVDRWAEAKTAAAVALICSWLEPMAKAAPPPPPAAGAGKPDKTRARPDPAGGPTVAAPELPKHVRHPLVRRGVVAALGALALELPEAERGPAIVALARSLDDPAGVVRAAAVRALVLLSNVDRFPSGSSVALEREVDGKLRAWLASR
jgi:hypothetical protein